MTAHAAELIPADQLVKGHRITTDITGPDHAYWLLIASEMVKEALGPIRQALEEYANKHGGIMDPSGRVWSGAPKSSEKANLEVDGAVTLLEEMGAASAIEHTVSWAAIERAVGSAQAEQIRAALRANGMTKVSTYEAFTWKKQKLRGRAA